MTRVWLPWIAAVIVAAAGIAGLARGAMPQQAATGGATNNSPPIVVSNAYIRQPASADVAAAYFTVYNTTAVPDTLISAITGAGEEATLHSETNGSMQITPNGVVIPAHGSVTFEPSTGHVMIQKLYGPLEPGQSVNIELDFKNAGPVVVAAPVIGIYATAPTGVASTSAPTPTTGATK